LVSFQLNFQLYANLSSDYEGNGRFGIALSKIGDINLDGYNDLAIGAPFEGDGAVYIYLGGPNGLSKTPSQRLSSPTVSSAYEEKFMFGHAISRGVDMDGNYYNGKVVNG
jgi:FG-GAP repeat